MNDDRATVEGLQQIRTEPCPAGGRHTAQEGVTCRCGQAGSTPVAYLSLRSPKAEPQNEVLDVDACEARARQPGLGPEEYRADVLLLVCEVQRLRAAIPPDVLSGCGGDAVAAIRALAVVSRRASEALDRRAKAIAVLRAQVATLRRCSAPGDREPEYVAHGIERALETLGGE